MPRSLANGHEKVIVLTTKPTNPAAPTLAELNAGIDAACAILDSDWTFGAVDSASFSERAVCEENEVEDYDVANFEFGMTVWRYFTAAGAADMTADTLFAASKVKNTRLWVYSRLTSKRSTDPLAAADELRLGAEIVTDIPRRPGGGGYIKYRVPGKVQRAWPFITVAAS